MPDTREPDAAATRKMMAAAVGNWPEALAAKPTSSCNRSRCRAAYRLARLSELLVSSGSVARSCRSGRIPA